MRIDTIEFCRGIRGTDPILSDTKKHIAFAGRSNVGKSSVINALLGRKDMARASATPGKTTEINFYLVNEKFYFADLPGYGYAKAPDKEKEKLVKTILWYLLESGAPVTLVFLIIDASVGPTERDEEMLRALRENEIPFAVIGNKIDKIGKSSRKHHERLLAEKFAPERFIPFSAKEKIGIADAFRAFEETL